MQAVVNAVRVSVTGQYSETELDYYRYLYGITESILVVTRKVSL